MTKKINTLIVLWTMISGNILLGQEKIDGIAAVIDEEIIIKSEVEAFYNESKTEYKLSSSCDALEQMMQRKLLYAKAKKDTLIIVDEDRLNKQADEYSKKAITQLGSEEKLLERYGYASFNEYKQELLRNQREAEYIQEIVGKINKGLDASPVEVNDFYKKYQQELPDVDEEIEFSQLIIKPEMSDTHRKELIDKLTDIRNKILNKETTFEDMAKEYSSDVASAQMGGLMKNVGRKMMVKDFEAVMFNLEEGEISEPFETEFGYHIVLLEKRKGEILDVRHILLANKPTADEIKLAKEKAKMVSDKLAKAEITFEQAVKEYSNDKENKQNKGKFISQGAYKIPKTNLPNTLLLELSLLEEGKIGSPFEYKDKTKGFGEGELQIQIIRLDKIYPKHKMNILTDYDRIKQFVVNEKENKGIEKWIKENTTGNFIKIAEEYKKCSFENNWIPK